MPESLPELPSELPLEPTLYRLAPPKGGAKGGLWAAFTPGGHGLRQTWQLSVSLRNRGGAKIIAPLLETSGLRSLASVTVKGEAYPLPIDWHEMRRGGQLVFGGARKLGPEGGTLDWEMRWLPLPGAEGALRAALRVRTAPRRTGALRLDLACPLFQPEHWAMPRARSGGARVAWSAYSRAFVGAVSLDTDADWDPAGGLALDPPPLNLGGKPVSFGLCFGAAATAGEARAALVTLSAAFGASALHPLDAVPPLDPSQSVARLVSPDGHAMQGMERLYLNPPTDGDQGSFFAGLPHEPGAALRALEDRSRFHADPAVPRLVRFGARGLCADFQVMGRAGQPEPNKGAFWDKMTWGVGTDFADGPTHGLRSNARLARSLFGLHTRTKEPLLLQSALNIGHWLLLKQNSEGFYDGAHVRATRGLPDDGRFLPQPCALDGAEAIRAFVPAYHATGNEVWIKAANRVADFLLAERGRDFDELAPASVAGVVLSLLALDGESSNPRLRAALAEWGAWLLSLPLDPALPSLSPDGLHAGLYECAQAGFGLWGLTRDAAYLRYAFAALRGVPDDSRARSWRAVEAHQTALLSLAGLLPGSKIDLDAPSVTLDWRVFAPDPAAAPFLRVLPAGGAGWVDWLPLVCRGTDQLLLLLLAPPGVEAATVWKNGRRPLLRDLRTGLVDTETSLPLLSKDNPWARVGLFTVDP